jgi:enoyl-CoA hydratase
LNVPKRVAVAVRRGVGIVRLCDPDRRNALSTAMSEDLAVGVQRVLEEGVGAIALVADPPAFCAGGSLDELLADRPPLRDRYRGFLALAEAPVPRVAAVAGAAVGAGVNLALACDVILTAPRARFDLRFLDLGIHPGGGHLWRLRQRVGNQGVAAMVLFGETLDGHQAVNAGLAWRCVEASDLESTAVDLAQRAASRPGELVQRTLATMRSSDGVLDPTTAFELELEAQLWSMEQPEFVERVQRIKQSLGQVEIKPRPDV